MYLKPPTASVVGRGVGVSPIPLLFWSEEHRWQRLSISTDSLSTTCVFATARTETTLSGWIFAPWRQRCCPTKKLSRSAITPLALVTRQKILSERLGKTHTSEP